MILDWFKLFSNSIKCWADIDLPSLIFETTFSLHHSIKNAELHLTTRKGSIEVLIDGDSKGIVAWQPNTIKIGDISEGKHTLTLKVIGDGIGIFHEGYFEAGCTALKLLVFT